MWHVPNTPIVLGMSDLITFLILIAVFGALANLLPIAFRGVERWWQTGNTTPGRPIWCAWVAVGISAAAWAVIFSPSFGGGADANPPTVLAALVWTVGGIAWLGVVLGRRLQVRIEVLDSAGKRSDQAAAFTSARLSTMGSHKPRGADAPQGSDVGTLPADALSATPTSTAAWVAYHLVRAVLSMVPWHAKIAVVDCETATIELRRFGKQVRTTVLYRSALGLAPLAEGTPSEERDCVGTRDLLTAAAALIVIELSVRHRCLKHGLCGATRWRSLACQVLAGTPPWEDDSSARTALLAEAVDKDPGNHAAWLAYYVERSGKTAVGETETELLLARRLKALLDEVEQTSRAQRDEIGYAALHLRLHYSYATTLLNAIEGANHRTRPATTNWVAAQLEEVDRAASKLESLLDVIEGADAPPAESGDGLADRHRELRGQLSSPKEFGLLTANLRRYAAEVRPSAVFLRQYVDYLKNEITGEHALREMAGQRFVSLEAHYNRACIESQLGKLPESLEDLDLAVGGKKYQELAVSDPFLDNVWNGDGAASLTRNDQTLSRIALFAPHLDRLRRHGIRYPADLLLREDPEALATALDVPAGTLRWMQHVCLLAQLCPRPEQRADWTELLTLEGVTTIEELRHRVGEPEAELPRALRERGSRAGIRAPSAGVLDKWAQAGREIVRERIAYSGGRRL